MQFLLERFTVADRHPEYADGSGDGRIVRNDPVRAGGDQIASGSGIRAVTGDDGLIFLQQFDFPADHLGRDHFAAGGIDPENDRLDGGIRPDLRDFPGELLSRDAASGTDDVTLRIQDGDLVGALVLEVLDVVGHRHFLQLVRIVHPEQMAEVVLHLVAVFQAVHEASVQPVLRVAQGQMVGPVAERIGAEAPGGGHVFHHRLPEGAEEGQVLFPVLGAHLAADIRLSGRFVAAVADQFDLDAEAVQQVFIVHGGRCEAGQAPFGIGMHEYAVSHGTQVIGPVSEGDAVADDRFARPAEPFEAAAQFLRGRHAGGNLVRTEEDQGDVIVLGGLFQGPFHVQQ